MFLEAKSRYLLKLITKIIIIIIIIITIIIFFYKKILKINSFIKISSRNLFTNLHTFYYRRLKF